MSPALTWPLAVLLWSTMSSRGCCFLSCSMVTTFWKPKLGTEVPSHTHTSSEDSLKSGIAVAMETC